MLSLFFIKKNKNLIQVEIWRRDIFKHFHNESNIFTHFYAKTRPKWPADTSRTPQPLSSHWLHCQDYRDNVHIFTYTFYLYVPRTVRHPKRIRFTCTSRVYVDQTPPNPIAFQCTPLWLPLTLCLTPLYVYVLRIRLTLLPLWPAPLTYLVPLYVYILLIHITYTYYLYIILIYNTYY